MYKDYIVYEIEKNGITSGFSCLYGVKEDNTTEIIKVDFTLDIKEMYKAVTDKDKNHENEEKQNIDNWLLLDDFYKWEFTEDEKISVNGKTYNYEMTLNPEVPDVLCMRVNINGFYFHFS